METREIPADDWAGYFDDLSERCRDTPVRIQVEGKDVGDQPLADKLPLLGISLETRGSEDGAIDITLESVNGDFSHRISRPEHVYAEITEGGAVKVLDIEDANQVKTLVFFEAPEAPSVH